MNVKRRKIKPCVTINFHLKVSACYHFSRSLVRPTFTHMYISASQPQFLTSHLSPNVSSGIGLSRRTRGRVMAQYHRRRDWCSAERKVKGLVKCRYHDFEFSRKQLEFLWVYDKVLFFHTSPRAVSRAAGCLKRLQFFPRHRDKSGLTEAQPRPSFSHFHVA